MADLTLYTYWRSSAAYRVRIALNLKGLNAQMVPVNLLHAEQRAESFGDINPQRMVPVLLDGPHRLTQSLAILEYLDQTYPTPPLLPADPLQAARVRAIVQIIACDIHPLNVPRVTQYLTQQIGISEEQKTAWMRHWMNEGLTAVEALLSDHAGHGFCVGDSPSMADCLLVPQVYSARRFEVDMEAFPLIRRINEHCLTLPHFRQAAPEAQADAL